MGPVLAIATATVVALLSGCGASDSGIPADREFTGYYTNSFENSLFIPCGSQERWWAVGSSLEVAAARRVPGNGNMGAPSVTWFARVRGVVTTEGAWGHMGGYSRQLMVHRVSELRAPRASDCGRT